MKKRILVLLLALVMVAGFALPAVAAQDEIVSDEPVVIAEEASTTEEETSTTEEEASTTEEEASTTEEETSTTEEASTTEEETSTTEESVDEPAPASVEAEDEALLAAVSVSDGAGTHTPSTKTVEYVDENGVTRTVTATKIESNSTTGGDGGYDYKDWNTGWYYVEGTKELGGGAISVSGNVNLILCDGATLTSPYGVGRPSGIELANDASLTIYGQSAQTGKLVACITGYNKGTLTVNGGKVVAMGENEIMETCGVSFSNGSLTMTVNGGEVTAAGGDVQSGPGLSYGMDLGSGSLTVNGGKVTASGGVVSNNPVSKSYGIIGNVTFNGGTLVAKTTSTSGAKAAFSAAPTLSGSAYYWRTAESGNFAASATTAYTHGNNTYVELTTQPNGGGYISYMAWDDTNKKLTPAVIADGDYTVVTGSTSMVEWGNSETMQEVWYVVKDDVTISGQPYALWIVGRVNLILCDGATLTVQDSEGYDINCSYEGFSLTIYGQTAQTGRLKVPSADNIISIQCTGPITVNGGVIDVSAGKLSTNCVIEGDGGMTLHNGTIKVSRDEGPGMFRANPTLPTTYYWRTAESAAFTKNTTAAYTTGSETYVEITTTKPTGYMPHKVEYMDYNSETGQLVEKECADPIKVTSGTTTWGESDKETWYVVDADTTIDSAVTVTGNVNLILCDGKALKVEQSTGVDLLTVADGGSLTVYGQSGQSGFLNLKPADGESTGSGVTNGIRGSVTVNGGRVYAQGANQHGIDGAVTVNHGEVEAIGNLCGISGAVSVNGGKVVAESAGDSSGFGSTVNLVSGTVIAKSSDGNAITTAPTLPTTYYWRTADNANYKTQKVLHTTSDLEGKYFEVTTTKPTSSIEPYVTGTAATVTYGDAVDGSVITAITDVNGAFAWKNVASYGDASAAPKKLMATFTPSDSSYVAVDVEVSVTVNQKDLTVTAKDHSITYGDEAANNGVSYTGFVAGEDESKLGGTLAYDYTYSRYGDVGSGYTITPKGLTSGNYNIKFRSGALTVEPKTIGIDWSDTKLTHNGKAQKPTATATGLVNGDECTITVTGEQTEAGTYTATATGLDNPNYRLPENVTCEFTIAAAKADGKGNAPHTGDAGVALYVISAASSMTGLVWLGRKKKR